MKDKRKVNSIEEAVFKLSEDVGYLKNEVKWLKRLLVIMTILCAIDKIPIKYILLP